MKCTSCGHEFENAKFCPECGEPAQPQPAGAPPVQSAATPYPPQGGQVPSSYPPNVQPAKKKGGCLKVGLIVVGVLILIGIVSAIAGGKGAGTSSSKTSQRNDNSVSNLSDEEIVRQRILDVSEYYDTKIVSELSQISKNKDTEGIISLLSEATARFEEDVTFFMEMSRSDNLNEEYKQACLDAKTGLYGANSSALQPALQFFSDGTGAVPDDFVQYVFTGQEYLNKAKDAVK